MRFSTRLAKIIFITTALVLLFISTMLYVQIKDLTEANNAVNHTNEVKLYLEQVLSYSKDAETAQRGYLLTRDSLFLQPYLGAFEKTNLAISHLTDLTHGNKQQQENVGVLDSLIRIRFASFDRAIDSFYTQGSDKARKQLLLKEKALLDSVRKQTNRMESIEIRELHERIRERDKHAFLAPLATILLIFIALAVLSLAYYRITLDLNRSKIFLDQLQKLNAELLEKNRQLQLSNEELDSFNYISSHDLQEPVRKIRTFISIIEDEDFNKLSEKTKHNFQRIQQASTRIQELLHDLITYSHINKPDKEFTDVDLNAIVEKAKLKFKQTIEETQTLITHPQLPVIRGIPYQLEQLFEQLISNSLKYKKQNVPVKIKIESRLLSKEELKNQGPFTSATYHEIIFRDNGVGFDQTYENKIFELFSRLHNDDNGTGIGLTICKKVVQNHTGFIQVKSKIDKGTAFYIYLPA
jgi:signal transduction histidine kinase